MPPKKAAAGPSKKNVEKKKDKVIEASSVLEVWGFLFFLFLVTCVVVSISIAHSIHFHPSMFIHSFHRQRQNYVKASRLGLSRPLLVIAPYFVRIFIDDALQGRN